MTINLTVTGWTGSSNGVWTNDSNKVIDNIDGVVNLGITANTLSGRDSIIGSGGVDTGNGALTGLSPIYFGVENLGTITMGNGRNTIIGNAIGIDPTYFVFGIYNEGSIAIGNGNGNSITGRAKGDGNFLASNFGAFSVAGIYNRSGTITIGNGNNNSITGIGTATGVGLYSAGIFNRQGGTITLGDGNNNSITGVGGFFNGIYNRGTIKMGNGNNDSITGFAKADAQINFDGILQGAYGIYNQNVGSNPSITIGNGNNVSIIGTAIGSLGVGIYNDAGSTIAMGNGKGTIIGKAIGRDGIGIYNGGTIDAGDGNDKLFSSVNINCVQQKVTLDGEGIIKMGLGNDYFQGFGSMTVYGDAGTGNTSNKDVLDLRLFKSCDFTIDKIGVGDPTAGNNYAKFTYNDPLLGSVSMKTNEFDKFIFADKTVNYSHLA